MTTTSCPSSSRAFAGQSVEFTREQPRVSRYKQEQEERQRREEQRDELLAKAATSLERIAATVERRQGVAGPAPPRDPYAIYDGIGRKQPKRLSISTFVRAIPALAEHFTAEVPATSISAIGIGPTGVVAVQCPCGASTEVPHDSALDCTGACGRMFWNFAGRVRVAYDRE